MESSPQSNRDRFHRQKRAPDATAIRRRKSDRNSGGTFSRAQGRRSRGDQKTGQRRSGCAGSKHFGSLDGKATAQEISEWMVPDLFNEAEWKRWWESARKHLKTSGAFSIPAKKTEPIQI